MRGTLDCLYPVHGSDVILSIHSEHAEKIYVGNKLYELRKVAPKTIPRRVFLYDTSKKAITGYFCTKFLLKGPVDEMWLEVGESATEKSRFFSYYQGHKVAVAFKISNSLKFSKPIPFSKLIDAGISSSVPQVFTYISGSNALNILDRMAQDEVLSRRYEKFSFRPLEKDNHQDFLFQVDKHISGSYQETGKKYAEYLVGQHENGFDSEGVFTTRKLCLEIWKSEEIFGYIVLTFKRGGSVKTGPTIVLDKFREKGYGRVMREKLHEILSLIGYRKVYVTIPAINKPAFYYLIESGYLVESHLRRHYHSSHDELVLGFSLDENANDCPKIFRSRLAAFSFKKMRSRSPDVALFLARRFPEIYFPVPDSWIASQISLAAHCARNRLLEFKGRLIFYAENDGAIKMVALCVIKRGGSAKIVLLSDIDHEESIIEFLNYVSLALIKQDIGIRKLYSHIAVSDSALYSSFLGANYSLEGVIKRPYNCYRDMLVMAREL